MNPTLGSEVMTDASSYSPAEPAHATLFPLPLTTCPRTHNNSGHRRRRHQRASAVHTITNIMIRALNTLYLNFPAAHTARQFRSAVPSEPQSRLTDTLLNAAAVYNEASRQCFDVSTRCAEGVKSFGAVGGDVTLIPGCTLRGPRPRAQVLSFPLSPYVSAPVLHPGLSLFIFDESGSSYLDSVTTAMPDTYAVQFSRDQSTLEEIAHSLQLFDTLPLSTSAFQYVDTLPTGLMSLVADRVALPTALSNVPLLSLLPSTLASLYVHPPPCCCLPKWLM